MSGTPGIRTDTVRMSPASLQARHPSFVKSHVVSVERRRAPTLVIYKVLDNKGKAKMHGSSKRSITSPSKTRM
jgi:hypothetical protein